MKTVHAGMGLATILTLGLFPFLALAQGRSGDKPLSSLKEFVGAWSRAEAGCTPEVSGPLDDLDKATANKHALLGICAEGFNLVRQPVRCIRGS